ncbi:MAG: hypothetical protein ACXQS4_04810 [Methermicoccaceae archaeon]
MNDHDLLVRIDERVGDIQLDVEELKDALATHTTRIGALERWRAYVLGGAAVVAFIVSVLVGVAW